MNIRTLEHVQQYVRMLSSDTEKAQISRYVRRQHELGHLLQKPVSSSLRDGINEIRPGPHRLLFFFHEGSIVICHAFRKQTHKTPEKEIEAAISIRTKYKAGG